jgi:outer membrane lipoprotein-sorting protein
MKGLLKTVPGFAVWFCLAFASPVAPSQSNYLQESEAKAKEILSKAIQALGGEAYLKLQDVHRTGRFYQFRKDDLQGTGHFHAYEKFPSKSRFELGKKGEIININDGDKGWKIEYKVVKDQSPEEIENFKIGLKHDLDHTLRYRLDEPGMRLRYLGKTRSNLDELEGVQLIDKDNDRMKIFVNAATFLPARMEFRSPAFGKRGPTDDERHYYNYHTVEGVQVPYSTVRFANGYKASEFQVESVKVNLALPDTFFTPNFKK